MKKQTAQQESIEKTISFVMPCFNDGDSIERAVESIRDQDLKGIEIIIVNDGSTDNSKVLIDAMHRNGDVDKVIHFETNKGACMARNEGAKIAEGKYLSFLPADAILYPGMARIWYTNLEEHPDYDFLYGGYRIIDENEEPVPGNEFLFEPFDPYLLEVTNYIDGSFPIRTTSFWKYAKLMNQPDGLWDPKIKSLQDWDFWLNVVKNGGKGLYIQDIFFGTTAPHKGGLSDDSANNWLERTEAIKAKHNIPLRRLCVASIGAGWHAKRVAYMLGADFKEMPSFKPHRYDTIYEIGFYPEFAKQQDAMFLKDIYHPDKGRSGCRSMVHFVGSDIWQLYHIPLIHLRNIWQPYFKNIDVVLCEDEFTQLELKDLGIDAQVVPLPPAKLYATRPLPEKFTVACYLPGINHEFYKPKEMQAIAKALPDVDFKFFGNPAQKGKDPALSSNITYEGYITDMDSFISECSAIMRFPAHDGLAISVLEFILAGRYSVQSTPVKYGICVKDFSVDAVVEAIKQLQEEAKKGLNQVGSDYWRERLDHDKFRDTILKLAKYDPKEYWEKRAPLWVQQARNAPIETEEVKSLYTEVNPKFVLDIGCGDGRWVPHLMEWSGPNQTLDYWGIDISSNLIEEAKKRFPHLKERFEAKRIEDVDHIPNEKYDLAFAYTCFEHITEEEWPKTVEALKKVAKKALIIEPENFEPRYYCHTHDYRKDLNVIKELKLRDKTIFLCDLEK